MLGKAIRDLKAGLSLYYVWLYQAYHDITAKYKRTVLGSFWLAGYMVVTSVSMAILFGALFHQPLNLALPYVMGGILSFSLVSFILNDGAEMFMTSGGVIKNHAYPFTFYALHTACRTILVFLHNLVVYWIFLIIFQCFSVPHWTIILSLPIVILFMLSWGMLTAMLASRFRDMRFMLPYVGQLLSYLTPLFWRTDGLKGTLLFVVTLNPFYNLVEIVRQPLLGKAPTEAMWGLALLYTAIGVLGWLLFFPAFRRRIPFWV